MTISSTTRVAGPFTGNGSTSTFPFPFKVFEAADLFVVTLNVATAAVAVLALTTDYTAALNADQDANPGGSITLTPGGATGGTLATGSTLTITTGIAELQGLDLTNGGAFYPDVINNALDLLTILIQQLQIQANRSLKIPFVDGEIIPDLPPAAQRAGKLLMFDANGNPSLVSVAAGGVVPGAQGATGTIGGGNKVFTFIAAAGATPTPLVYVAGEFMTPGTDYGAIVFLSGTTWQITFTTAPVLGPVTVVLLA